jgi:hypothetical protein
VCSETSSSACLALPSKKVVACHWELVRLLAGVPLGDSDGEVQVARQRRYAARLSKHLSKTHKQASRVQLPLGGIERRAQSSQRVWLQAVSNVAFLGSLEHQMGLFGEALHLLRVEAQTPRACDVVLHGAEGVVCSSGQVCVRDGEVLLKQDGDQGSHGWVCGVLVFGCWWRLGRPDVYVPDGAGVRQSGLFGLVQV